MKMLNETAPISKYIHAAYDSVHIKRGVKHEKAALLPFMHMLVGTAKQYPSIRNIHPAEFYGANEGGMSLPCTNIVYVSATASYKSYINQCGKTVSSPAGPYLH